jgi:thiosulfate/3-mercaptopyruvate sulfurtransferase
MKQKNLLRFSVIAVLLVLGVFWALVSAKDVATGSYPNESFLAKAEWLHSHINDPKLVVVDVRDKKYLKDAFIPGAIYLEWKQFRETATARGIGGVFVGVDRAQAILGQAGIARGDTVVLYDNQARGAATASYVFWVLDVLGHGNKVVLERGIEAWVEAGFKTAASPRTAEPVLYQAPVQALRMDRWVEGAFIQARLGDPFYQILDVRSADEYLGTKLNKGLDGKPLKPGHVPSAYNIDYKENWVAGKSKAVKTYADLQALYAGLDPNRSVITYCHSGRRGSFSYFILRLMGFENVSLYDSSWFEWGNNGLFFPVETQARQLMGGLPGASAQIAAKGAPLANQKKSDAGSKSAGGYVSCGG